MSIGFIAVQFSNAHGIVFDGVKKKDQCKVFHPYRSIVIQKKIHTAPSETKMYSGEKMIQVSQPDNILLAPKLVKFNNDFWLSVEREKNSSMQLTQEEMIDFILSGRVLVFELQESLFSEKRIVGLLLTHYTTSHGKIDNIYAFKNRDLWNTIRYGKSSIDKGDTVLYWSIVSSEFGSGLSVHFVELANTFFGINRFRHRVTVSPVKNVQYEKFIETLQVQKVFPEDLIDTYGIDLYLASVRYSDTSRDNDIIGFEPYLNYLQQKIPSNLSEDALQLHVKNLVFTKKILSPVEFIRTQTQEHYKMICPVHNLHELKAHAIYGGHISINDGGRDDAPFTVFHVYGGFTKSTDQKLIALITNIARFLPYYKQ